jgi:hypothetical protein
MMNPIWSTFDGRTESLTPSIQNQTISINELIAEVNSLHEFMDRMCVPSYGPNGKAKIGERLEMMLKEPEWEKVK